MGQWVVTVCAIAILSAMCDVILPEGQTRKYVRTVFGVIVTLVMIKPIISFVAPALDVVGGDYTEIKIQQNYIDNVTRKKYEAAAASAKARLKADGIDVKEIRLDEKSESVTVYLNTAQNEQTAVSVRKTMSAYFSKLEIIIYWK